VILHAISLKGWRCFAESFQIGPFSDGLNVVHGPNGVGKSTIFEALVRALIDSHRVRGRDAEALRPWGRSLSPVVTVEFSHGGTKYRVSKGFLDKAYCELERKEDRRFVRFSEGEAADQFVRALLTKNPPGRGLARRDNWGLAQVLWAPQGELALLSLSGDVVADVRQMLGAQVSGPESGRLERRIRELYTGLYTTTRKLRSGRDAPELVTLQERLEDANERWGEAMERQQEFEELSRKVEDLRSRQAEAERTSHELEKRLMLLGPKVQEYNKLLSTRSEREAKVHEAEALHDSLKQCMDNIAKTRKSLAKTQEGCSKLHDELSDRELEARELRAKVERATKNLEDKRKERPKVKEAQDETELARRYLEALQRASNLQERVKKVRKLDQKLKELSGQRSKLVAPDNATIRNIRRTVKAHDEARLRLDAALITLQIVPSKKGNLTVVEAEESGSRTLLPEEPVEVKGSPRVVVDLAGVARLRAWGPVVSIDDMRKSLAKHANALSKLTARFHTADIEALEALNERGTELDKRITKLNTEIEATLGGSPLDDVERELSHVQSETNTILGQRRKWAKKAPDLDRLAKNAEAIRDKFVADVETAEQKRDAAQAAHAAANERKAATVARLEETETRLRDLQETLVELTSDGKTDVERLKESKAIARKWEAAKADFEEVEDKLRTYEYDPRTDLEKLEGLRKSADAEARKALSDQNREEGRLEQLTALGTYSSLAKIEEEIAVLNEAVTREQLRADAIRLLYDTVEECQNQALVAVGRPVEQAATRTLQRIAGTRIGGIQIGEHLEPACVLPQRTDESVSIVEVSGGEKEQIYLATRLALAEVLARNERHLVVLDDVLTATDSLRLARILRILEEAAERLQIVILTCHPERYGALTETQFFDLEELLRA